MLGHQIKSCSCCQVSMAEGRLKFVTAHTAHTALLDFNLA